MLLLCLVALPFCTSGGVAPKDAGAAEAELCAVVGTARAFERQTSTLPSAGTPRAQLEALEDKLCAARGDAGR
jgi:hypothetical protein